MQHTSVGAHDIFTTRESPFGPLSTISARRTYAYLIATLNASHPYCNFAHILKPSEFRKRNSFDQVVQTFVRTLGDVLLGGWTPEVWVAMDK